MPYKTKVVRKRSTLFDFFREENPPAVRFSGVTDDGRSLLNRIAEPCSRQFRFVPVTGHEVFETNVSDMNEGGTALIRPSDF